MSENENPCPVCGEPTQESVHPTEGWKVYFCKKCERKYPEQYMKVVDRNALVPAKCCGWCINVNPSIMPVTCTATSNTPEPNFYCREFRWAFIGMDPEMVREIKQVYKE